MTAWIERTLWLLGACCLSLYVLGRIDAGKYQAREARRLDRAVAAGRVASGARAPSVTRVGAAGPEIRTAKPTGPQVHILPADATEVGAIPPSSFVAAETPFGRIEIPSVGVSAMIKTGDDDATLRVAVGHIPGTARPGERGNVALAAHRDGLFRGLRNIRLGDEIRITTPRGDHKYVVQKTSIVKPTDVWVLDDPGEPVLTLITCYPFNYVGSAPKRFVVLALPVSVPDPPRVASAAPAPVKGSGAGAAPAAEGTSGTGTPPHAASLAQAPAGAADPRTPASARAPGTRPTPSPSTDAVTAAARGTSQKPVATHGPGTPTAESADGAKTDRMAAAAFAQEEQKTPRVRSKSRRASTGSRAASARQRDKDDKDGNGDKDDSGLKKGLKKMFSPFGKLFGAGKNKK